MKSLIGKCGKVLLILVLLAKVLFAQDPKPPVAEDDWVDTFISTSVSYNVLANDYSNEGDTLVIYAITGVSQGQAIFEDSLIYYTPENNNAHTREARVYYIIKDLTTGLWSNEAVLTIRLNRVKNRIFEPNNLGVRINAIGNQFMAVDSFCFEAPNHHFEAPLNSGKHTIYNSSLWVAGLDGNGSIHTACERYRKGKLPFMSHRGWDYWVGPVMNDTNYTDEYLTKHNRLWYITRAEIIYHNNNYQHSNYLVPKRIKQWPGNGFPELGTADQLAPYNDKNSNEIYDPENGDYPLIHGDEAVYFIFNDDYGEHTESFGRKLGIEVHGLAYGFNCPNDSAFQNTLFIRYDVINRSDTTYSELYLGNYTNLVIGGYDDYLACDTLLNAYYAYNMDDFDDTISVYYPGYLHHPPAQAVVWLNMPMDHFMFCQFPWPYNDTIYNFAPTEDHRYYNMMKSIWNDSTHLTYGGNGHLGDVEVNHALTGDPLSTSGWTEENSGMDNLILQAVSSHGPLSFGPGDTLQLELAYVFARDYEGDHLSSVELLKSRIEKISWYYENDSTPCNTPWTNAKDYKIENIRYSIVPNPVKSSFTLTGDKIVDFEYSLFNISGQLMYQGNTTTHAPVNVNKLEPGYYLVRFSNANECFTLKLLKH